MTRDPRIEHFTYVVEDSQTALVRLRGQLGDAFVVPDSRAGSLVLERGPRREWVERLHDLSSDFLDDDGWESWYAVPLDLLEDEATRMTLWLSPRYSMALGRPLPQAVVQPQTARSPYRGVRRAALVAGVVSACFLPAGFSIAGTGEYDLPPCEAPEVKVALPTGLEVCETPLETAEREAAEKAAAEKAAAEKAAAEKAAAEKEAAEKAAAEKEAAEKAAAEKEAAENEAAGDPTTREEPGADEEDEETDSRDEKDGDREVQSRDRKVERERERRSSPRSQGRQPNRSERRERPRPRTERRAAAPQRRAAAPAPRTSTVLTGPIVPVELLADEPKIPSFLIPIYKKAGKKYDIPWTILAAVNEIETDYGRNVAVSSAGATGWMQFMPASWRAFGVDANDDDRKDPNDPEDAIFAAAHYLDEHGAQDDLRGALFAYNHAGWYVDSVLFRAQRVAEHYKAHDKDFERLLRRTTRKLERQVLEDERIEIRGCGREDIEEHRVDRRVLILLRYLANSGLHPTVSSLRCGRAGAFTASGNVSHHVTGTAVDIAAINDRPITPGNQGRGSITDLTIRSLLALEGTMRPDQVISLMKYKGHDNTIAMGDHHDHIHVGFKPVEGGLPDGLKDFDGETDLDRRGGSRATRTRMIAGPPPAIFRLPVKALSLRR